LAESRVRRFQRTSGSTASKRRGFCSLLCPIPLYWNQFL
jgi:hypothetical protein